MIVIDASAMLDVLLGTSTGISLGARLSQPFETVHAPHLLDVEIAQVLRRYVHQGQIEPDQGQRALDDLADFRVTRYSHELLLDRVWQLRRNVTAYDAVYLALAELLDAPLLTRDKRLASAARRLVKVELV